MWYGWVMFAAGAFSWTLLEYAIHGWLGHRFHTFVTPIHAVHHRDQRAVFALHAWPPTAAVFAALYLLWGWNSATLFYVGLICGFAVYEAIHYRVHFAARLMAWETGLRAHHLAHHNVRPTACYGVTSPLWDRIFGTDWELPAPLRSSLLDAPPLPGPSNFGALIRSLAGRIQRAT